MKQPRDGVDADVEAVSLGGGGGGGVGEDPGNPGGAGNVDSNGMNAETWPWRCEDPLLLAGGVASADLGGDPSNEEAAAAAHAAAAIAAVL